MFPDPEAHARNSDPQTAKEAAQRVNAAQKERVVLQALVMLGGNGTSREVTRQSGLHEWTVSPRFKPLERRGYVRLADVPKRERQQVWEITPLGLVALQASAT